MKKFLGLIIITAGLTMPVFAQDAPQNKHSPFDNYFGLSLGAGGAKTNDYGVFALDFGVSYDFYLHKFISLNTGLLFHTEFYSGENLLTGDGTEQIPLCFTIPFGVHFNIPKAEWLYAGISIAINIPIADFNSGEQNTFSQKDIFLSMPIDLGFDFIQPEKGGSRVFLRVTPTFYGNGITVPVGIMWQMYNWKVFPKKVEVDVPQPHRFSL